MPVDAMMPSLTGTRAVSAQMSRSSAFTASALGIGHAVFCGVLKAVPAFHRHLAAGRVAVAVCQVVDLQVGQFARLV
ncbi:MAG: hypothetical protein KJ703_06165, partial [Alphaproteobacteria bacterium]|nr:hypothetical protein [Alphaproteobacteria bacterium]